MIAENLQKLINIKSDIKNAINGKGGSVGERFEDYAPAIENLPSGGGFVFNDADLGKKTIFVDITGEVVYAADPEAMRSWTDFSQVPEPSHPGMRFVGWTHDINDCNQGEWRDVGALFESEDGLNHFFFEATETRKSVDLYYTNVGLLPEGVVPYVDWGDGITEDLTGMYTEASVNHLYEEAGLYEVKVFLPKRNDANKSSIRIYDTLSMFTKTAILANDLGFLTMNGYILLDAVAVPADTKLNLSPSITSSTLKTLNFRNFTNFSLNGCYGLRYLCCPNLRYGVQLLSNSVNLKSLDLMQEARDARDTTPGGYFGEGLQRIKFNQSGAINLSTYFQTARQLKELILDPSKTTTLATGSFRYSTTLETFGSPDVFKTASTIGNYTFAGCYVLKGTLKFNNLTSIGSMCFAQAFNLDYLDFSEATQVPTLSSTNSFTTCFCKFLIPDALFDTWITTTNWNTLYTANPDRFVRV